MNNTSDESSPLERKWRTDSGFRVIMDTAADYAFVLLADDNRIVGWSAGAQRILGWSEQEVLYKTGALFFTPEDRAKGEVDREIETATRGGSAEDERWHLRKDGTRFWGSGVLTRINNPEHVGFMKIMRDRTEQVLAEQNKDRLTRLEREHLNMELQSASAALHRSETRLRMLTASLLTAQEAERRRIARELHDDLAQQTALIQFSAHAVWEELPEDMQEARRQLSEVEQHVETLATDIRKVSHRLHPAILDDLGLDIALATLCESAAKNRFGPVTYKGCLVPKLPPDVGAAIYRIAQEALRNSAKHASGSDVQVELQCAESQLSLVIHDSGPGFNLEQYERGAALGIISMQERALSVGGTLVVETEPGRGTTVKLTVPFEQSS